MDGTNSRRLNPYQMNARTKTLFHFTKSLDVMLKILREGFWPQYSLEDISWMNGHHLTRLAWPMVSFCDIPISRLGEHTNIYGDYGIGLCRKRLKSTGLNPILYISPDSTLKNLLGELVLGIPKTSDMRVMSSGMYLCAYCKPLIGDSETNFRDFYSECEWRFIPWIDASDKNNEYGFFLKEEEFNNESTREKANRERRNAMLTIVPDDVRYLLVKNREDAHKLVSFIDAEMKIYSDTARDVLKTQILVWDIVSSDL